MSRKQFFQQSGWMITATFMSGLCMFAVHLLAKRIPTSEYGIFGTMLSVLNCLSIPAVGLQMVFAQQTAAAVTEEEKRQLRGTARGVLWATLGIWLMALAVVITMYGPILERWHITNSAALWLTLMAGLVAVWKPLFGGILQGKQNFLWFGWSAAIEGAGRLASATLIVLVFHGLAAGMVSAILLGAVLGLALLVWHTRDVWLGPKAPFAWRPWLARVLPLTFGFGAFQVMFSADPMFVQAWFEKDQTGFYMAAGTLARALVAFTGPIVWVMFPKIVRSVAVSEKTDVMWLTLGTTGVLACMGALTLSFISPWLLPLVFNDSYLAAVPLLRWFAWSMVPLVLANVLINNLMARSRFQVVPWLLGVVGIYVGLLSLFHDSFLTVIKVIGLSNLLFLGVATWFTWRSERSE